MITSGETDSRLISIANPVGGREEPTITLSVKDWRSILVYVQINLADRIVSWRYRDLKLALKQTSRIN